MRTDKKCYTFEQQSPTHDIETLATDKATSQTASKKHQLTKCKIASVKQTKNQKQIYIQAITIKLILIPTYSRIPNRTQKKDTMQYQILIRKTQHI